MRDLNHYYLDHPALWSNDTDWQGFQWIACDDSEQSVISFRRIDEKGKETMNRSFLPGWVIMYP